MTAALLCWTAPYQPSLYANGWHFETSQFLQHGIIYVAVIPELSRLILLMHSSLFVLTSRRHQITPSL
ncbi:MAG: hypothetical protein V4672_00900 [Verrucomicrobiota bacterium]